MDWAKLQQEKMKGKLRELISHMSLIPKVTSLELFLDHSPLEGQQIAKTMT